MKRPCIIGLMLVFFSLAGSAQNISVKSFQLLQTDLTANLEGTKEIDQNGEVAALIKVITTETGFLFDVGMLGIVKQVQHPGEIWLYVPHGIQRININHQKLGRLAEPYYFPIPIVQARTYELELTTSKVKTIVEEDAGGGFLSLSVTPTNAVVYVDDALQSLDADGTLSLFLPYGEHTYQVDAAGCKSQLGKVRFDKEEIQTLNIVLQETDKALLTVVSEMSDAEIWVNTKKMGRGEWKGSLRAGTYVVEARKNGYRPYRLTVTVVADEMKTVTLDAPEPMYGRLRAESKPSGADVFASGKKLGTTPGIFNDVLAYTQPITFRKEGYAEQTVEVTVEEGKVATASVQLKREEAVRETTLDAVSPDTPAGTKTSRRAHEPWALKETGFYAGARYTLGVPMAGGVAVGTFLSGFNIEVYADVAIGSVTSVNWYYTDDYGTVHQFHQPYNPEVLLGGCVGYGIPVTSHVRVTPRVGADVLLVMSDGVGGYSQPQTSYVFSGNLSLRTEIGITRLFALTLTPQYNLPFRRGSLVQCISTVKERASLWNNGFALQAGFCFNF